MGVKCPDCGFDLAPCADGGTPCINCLQTDRIESLETIICDLAVAIEDSQGWLNPVMDEDKDGLNWGNIAEAKSILIKAIFKVPKELRGKA